MENHFRFSNLFALSNYPILFISVVNHSQIQYNMKEFIQKYQKTIVGIGALSVLTLSYFQNQQIHMLRREIKVMKSTSVIGKDEIIDSLNSELFIQQNIVGRYEIALEMLKEENPKAGEQYELILTTQTE